VIHIMYMEEELKQELKYDGAVDKLDYSRTTVTATRLLHPAYTLPSKTLKCMGHDQAFLYRLIIC
jgi:hypothetical protein